jgi:hypothetical protein
MNILDTLKNKSKNSKQNTILRKAENRKQVTSNHKQVLLSAFRLFDYLVVKAFPLSAFYVVTVFCFFSAFLLSCNNSTDPKEDLVTFSGTVTLEDTTDYSGVTVSLYAPVELDTALVRINQEYPNIGVQISQETEFDHREHEALYSTTTNADGSWEIKAEEGAYNIVVEKEGWGWKYDNLVENKQNFQTGLFKVQKLSGNYSNNIRLLEGHHYLVKENINIGEQSSLIIEPGVWIRFDGLYRIITYGSVEFNGTNNNFIHCTNNSLDSESGQWQFIELIHGKSATIEYTIFEKSKSGLEIKNRDNSSIRKCIFRNNQSTGLLLNTTIGTNISLCLFLKNDQSILGLYSIKDKTNKSVFYNSIEGIKAEYSSMQINDNYFYKNVRGVYSQFRPSPEIIHNEFLDNENGVRCAGSDPICRANNFHNNNQSIYIGIAYSSINANPLINYNNFIGGEYGIQMVGYPSGTNNNDINALNNWWDSIYEFDIQNRIFDKNDAGENSNYVEYVLYSPYVTSNIDTAGLTF